MAWDGKTSTASLTDMAKDAQILNKGKWAPNNYNAVQRLINQYGVKNPNYDPAKKPYAVFDWDNTCVMNDIEESLFIYQINHLAYKLTPDEFAKVIRNNVSEGQRFHDP